MIRTAVLGSLVANSAIAFHAPVTASRHSFVSRFSSNSDTFGAGKSDVSKEVEKVSETVDYNVKADGYADEAARLRQEAAEMEIALRDEARAKGLPEEMINKIVPVRGVAVKKTEKVEPEPIKKLRTTELRSKLGYLNTGDAVRMVSELDRIKSKEILSLWNAKDFSGEQFAANNVQVKSKTGIDIPQLRLDDAGFEYQKVFGLALLFATTAGLGASFVGGQLGFLLGYASALFPILLVGVGSIAPTLIADILNSIKYATDEKEREKNVHKNAAKFLVGYVAGLPLSSFSTSKPSNKATFFQLRPSGRSEAEDKAMFSSKKFPLKDIARSSVTSIAGPVGECMAYGEASGSSGNDINILYDLINAADPPLKQDAAQNYIRWCVIASYDILKQYDAELKRLNKAFAEGYPLEECIAIIEGDGSPLMSEGGVV